MGVERGEPVDDRLRLLRRCAIVEPDEAAAVHLLLQDGKIVADRGGVEGPRARDPVGEDRRDPGGRSGSRGGGRRSRRRACLGRKAVVALVCRKRGRRGASGGLGEDQRGAELALRRAEPDRLGERRKFRRSRVAGERVEIRPIRTRVGKPG